MTDTRHQPSGDPGYRDDRSDWWSRRPRRSRTDSKIAGVAGGLGRYLGVDPILFRVGFVALTILGGAGVLAYCLLWLLLPADGDDVSAGESLIGRGRSSVSPILAVGLALLIVISITSSISWGLPFWPVAIAALIAFHIARKQRRGPFRPGSDWQQRMNHTGEALRTNQWPDQNWTGRPGSWSEPNRWGQNPESRSQSGWGGWSGWGQWGCNSHGTSNSYVQGEPHTAQRTGQPTDPTADPTSPFESPAFWDSPGSTGSGSGSATSTSGGPAAFGSTSASSPSGSTGTANTPGGATPFAGEPGSPGAGGSAASGSSSMTGLNPDTLSAADPAGAHRSTPPSWDPLGAAPFAWDLPDIEVAPQQTQTLVRRRTASPVIGRAAVGTALLVTAVQVFGIMVGWWSMAWAAISGTALALVAVGLLVQALRGRTLTLIVPGVLLSVLTIGLSLTGISGPAAIDDASWKPTTVAAVQPAYEMSVGQAILDLSDLKIPGGQTVSTSVELGAGRAEVNLPAGVNLDVTCTSNAGHIDCAGMTADGLRNERNFTASAGSDAGTLKVDVHVGTGDVVVTR